MLKLHLDSKEFYTSEEKFMVVPEQTIVLEHSLSSLYDWESKWHRPFLDKKPKTEEQVLSYMDMMVVEGALNGVPLYYMLNPEMVKTINDYILDPMTATWFNERENSSKKNNEVVTAELIYFWMTALNIPFECDKWHLNRLLTLIKVCSVKNAPPKKMSKREIFQQNQALNAARRNSLRTKG